MQYNVNIYMIQSYKLDSQESYNFAVLNILFKTQDHVLVIFLNWLKSKGVDLKDERIYYLCFSWK